MPPDEGKIRFLKILLHAGFFVSGIATVIIGQVLPILAARLGLNDREAGDFFIWQFSGSLFGTFLTNWFGRRSRFMLATVIGCFLMAAGILLLNADSFLVCRVGFLINGVGIGLTLPAINMLIFELNPERAGAALNVLNFFWGVGAIVSQPFVDFTARGESIRTPTVILAVFLAITGAAILVQPKEIEQKPAAGEESAEEDFSVPIWTTPLAWGIALFNFVHVGFESAMGGWLKTYTQRIEGEAGLNLFPPIFLYFLFFVAGRGAAPVFFRFLDENKMLIASLLTILLGMLILLAAENIWFLSVGAAVAGFGTSSIFPTNVSRFTKTFGASATRRATPLFLCGTLGAAFTTWFIGFLSNLYGGNLRAGMFVLLGSVVFLIVLQFALNFSARNSASEPQS